MIRALSYKFLKSFKWVRVSGRKAQWEHGLFSSRKAALEGTTGYSARRVWVAEEKES